MFLYIRGEKVKGKETKDMMTKLRRNWGILTSEEREKVNAAVPVGQFRIGTGLTHNQGIVVVLCYVDLLETNVD